MQTCSVCGQTFGLTHSCPGAIAAAPDAAALWVPPKGFAPGYYMRQAVGIARLEEGAILAASRDEKALAYGAILWLCATLIAAAPAIVLAIQRLNVQIPDLPFVFKVLFVALLTAAATALLQWGIIHMAARWLFSGRGAYLGIVRAMLLGSVTQSLFAVPWIGPVIAGVWQIAILMRVFEEVEGIERMQAFGLSLGVSIVFYALVFLYLAPRH